MMIAMMMMMMMMIRDDEDDDDDGCHGCAGDGSGTYGLLSR